jgi:polyisoprenoid-binding protein YceI
MKSLILSLLWLVSVSLQAQSLTVSNVDSKISFVIKNMGMDVDGTLNGLKGKMYFDKKNLAASYFDMTVDVNTINTGNEKRNTHLKTDEFFNAAKFPVINIKTTKILSKGNNIFFAFAVLSIKGVSKNIQFDFIVKPQANGYIFSSSFPLNRRDYGVGGNSMILSDKLTVSLNVLAKRKA